MSSVRRMSQDAKSEAQEQERNHKRKRLPFPEMEKAASFLKFKVSRSIFVGEIIYYNNITI